MRLFDINHCEKKIEEEKLEKERKSVINFT